MRRSTTVALIWIALNVLMATRLPFHGRFPWGAVLFIGAVLPAMLLFLSEPIAGSLKFGRMARFASDYGQPQSPVVIRILGWMVLVLQTGFLVSYMK